MRDDVKPTSDQSDRLRCCSFSLVRISESPPPCSLATRWPGGSEMAGSGAASGAARCGLLRDINNAGHCDHKKGLN